MNSWRERAITALAGAATLNRKIVLLLILILIAIASVLIALNSPRPYTAQSLPQNIETPAGQLTIIPAQNFVHLVGEILHPGIYKLDSGSRLFDAILAAGGFTDAADQSSVNLAREVTDGEQIIVLATGVDNPASLTYQLKQISLNRSSEAELESLPGVGPALAGRIVDWRTTNGGFKKKQDLLRVSGIGQKLFDGIEKLVVL